MQCYQGAYYLSYPCQYHVCKLDKWAAVVEMETLSLASPSREFGKDHAPLR